MLHLYVHDPNDEFDEGLPPSALPIATYLEKRPDWIPALEETWLVLETSGGAPLIELNPFGWLSFLAPQLKEAAERLHIGKFALLRSAGDWTPLFLALEPDGKMTRLSALSPLPRPWASYYPLAKSPFFTPEPIDQREALYAYIEKQRELLRPGQTTSADERALQRVELPTDKLVQSLREEARVGLCLVEVMASEGEK